MKGAESGSNGKKAPTPKEVSTLRRLTTLVRKEGPNATDKLREQVARAIQKVLDWQQEHFPMEYKNHEDIQYQDDIALAMKFAKKPEQPVRRFPRGDGARVSDKGRVFGA